MKTLTLLPLLLLAVVGCGGGGSSVVDPPDYSGTWRGPFSGDLSGTLTVRIEASSTMDITGTSPGFGSFSGEAWLERATGNVSGDLGSLGKFSGKVRLVGRKLRGEANLAKGKAIAFELAEVSP